MKPLGNRAEDARIQHAKFGEEVRERPPTDLLNGQLLKMWKVISRAMRLRCPACGEGLLFLGWFRMAESCPNCGLLFSREPGFYLGSIYVNYGLTALLVTVGYFAMFFGDVLSDPQRLGILIAFSILFPLWFFRYARALWLGFDQLWDPQDHAAGGRQHKPPAKPPTS